MALQKRNNLYEIVSSSTEIDSEFKEKLAYRIFVSGDRESLQLSIDNDSNLKSDVESICEFALKLMNTDETISKKTKNAFVTNNFEFKDATLTKMDEGNFMFFVKQNLYEINSKNVFDIYSRLTNEEKNTFSIDKLLNTNIKEMIERINDSFDELVMLLNENENTYESSSMLLRIMNESTISDDLKISIIKKNVFPVNNVAEVNDSELRLNFFRYKKYKVSLYNVMKATTDEVEYVLSHFTDSEKIQEFITEAKENLDSDEKFEKELVQFMNNLVNNHNINVNETNVDFFKINSDYSVEGMNKETFHYLLKVDCIKPTIKNLEMLSGKEKINLMNKNEDYVAKFYDQLSMNEEEIVMGLSTFDEPLLKKIIESSFKNGSLIIEDKINWLKEIFENKIKLISEEINVLFTYEELTQSNVLLMYFEYIISENLLSSNDILENTRKLDKKLMQVEKGLQGTKKADVKYYELLNLLKERNLISSVSLTKDLVRFNNKLI